MNAQEYLEVGKSLKKGETVRIIKTSYKTPTQLFCKAIKKKPDCAEAYFNLANTLPRGGSILLHGPMVRQ
jgi:hypothetical protein